jgi:hypothetical protein
MKKHKEFDCVQMKSDIQKRLSEEFRGMSPKEMRLAQQQRIASDPSLGPFLQKIENSPPKVAQPCD